MNLQEFQNQVNDIFKEALEDLSEYQESSVYFEFEEINEGFKAVMQGKFPLNVEYGAGDEYPWKISLPGTILKPAYGSDLIEAEYHWFNSQEVAV